MITSNAEVGQSSPDETLGDTGAVNDLLSDTSHHLGNVDLGTLGAADGHDEGAVVLLQLVQANLSGVITNLTELTGDLGLQGLLRGATRRQLEISPLELLNELVTLVVSGLHQQLLLAGQTGSRPDVIDSNGKSLVTHPSGTELGQTGHAVYRLLRAVITKDHVENGSL